jgi:Flp pilus assembly pilin Flp
MTNACATIQPYLASRRSEQGATAVEYGSVVALIAGVVTGPMVLLGTRLSSKFIRVGTTS